MASLPLLLLCGSPQPVIAPYTRPQQHPHGRFTDVTTTSTTPSSHMVPPSLYPLSPPRRHHHHHLSRSHLTITAPLPLTSLSPLLPLSLHTTITLSSLPPTSPSPLLLVSPHVTTTNSTTTLLPSVSYSFPPSSPPPPPCSGQAGGQ